MALHVELFHVFLDSHAVFKVLEDSGDGHARAPKNSGATNFSGGRSLLPGKWTNGVPLRSPHCMLAENREARSVKRSVWYGGKLPWFARTGKRWACHGHAGGGPPPLSPQ